MKITILDCEIENYSLYVERRAMPALRYAAELLQRYLGKITGSVLPVCKSRERCIFFEVQNTQDNWNDGYEITLQGDNLRILSHNGRGAIYAVYALLEHFGYRFFSSDLPCKSLSRGEYADGVEILFDKRDKHLGADFSLKSEPTFFYRDNYTHAVVHDEEYVKYRLNAATWGLHSYTEEWGGGLRFSGPCGHSFRYYISPKKYYASHPEFFALLDGKRANGADGSYAAEPQLCLTNDELSEVFCTELIAQLEKEPANYVSVSQNDSDLFCTCEKCKKSYREKGYFGTLMNFVNKVTRRLKTTHPHVKVHTYAYMNTADVDERATVDENVCIQFCPRVCHCHALDDPTCAANVKIYESLRRLGKVTKNIFIYDYRSCLGHAMFLMPDITLLRRNMRVYAECGVTGIYTEGNIHSLFQPTMEELRLYLFSKLTWNPYMSEEEFHTHIDEFLCGFYGENWRFVKEFILYYEANAKHRHVDSFCGSNIDDDCNFLWREDGNILQSAIFEKRKVKEIIAHCNELLEKAKESVEERFQIRIKLLQTSLLWYELFHTMKEDLSSATEEEKKALLEKNAELCSRMLKYGMRLTPYLSLKKASNAHGNYLLPPADWHGTPHTTDKEAFNFDSWKNIDE